MKTLLLLLTLLICWPAQAATVRFEWDANPAEDEVASYQLWERVSADTTRLVATVNGDTVTTSGEFAVGAHAVFVTAVSAEGVSSGPSNTVTFRVPNAPGTLKIKIAIESSDDGVDWAFASAVEVDASAQRQFYRIAFAP